LKLHYKGILSPYFLAMLKNTLFFKKIIKTGTVVIRPIEENTPEKTRPV
jgi:hypothetical protein